MKLPNLEEQCLAILYHPRALDKHKRLAARVLRSLGLGDHKGLYDDNGEDQFFDPDHFNQLNS